MIENNVPEPVELLIFELAGQEFALDINSVSEVRGYVQATSLPHAPTYMNGVINLRGTVLPVVDLGARLGFALRALTQKNVIIVVSNGVSLTGLVVDAVADILTIAPDSIQKPPEALPESKVSFVSGLTVIEDRLIRILDLVAIVAMRDPIAA